jgi:type IV pilus assembly protein PilX
MVLICALMLMLAAMVIGVAIARGSVGALAAARNERDREVAQAAAEAALRDGERDIAGTDAPLSERAARFSAAGAAAFVNGCGHGGADRGLCSDTPTPAWQSTDLAAAGNPVLVPYGDFTGAQMATGRGLLPARRPAYLIERLAPPGVGAEQGTYYRISAIGFGMRATTQVVLQSLYHKLAPAAPAAEGDVGAGGTPGTGDGGANGAGTGGAPSDPSGAPSADPPAIPRPQAPPAPQPLPPGRIGWRAIDNWSELHARTLH